MPILRSTLMFLLLLIALLAGTVVQAMPIRVDAARATDVQQEEGRQFAFDELPWQCQLGVRSANLSDRIAIADRVVLVPDLATWLDEISRWKPGLHWPVLIEDDRYTPLFVRRFKPARLIRRPSIGTDLPTDAVALERAVRDAAVMAWGGDPSSDTLESIYESLPWWTPPGIVATSFTDPAWPAALALTIGHGQLLRTLDGSFGNVNDSLDEAGLARLQTRVGEMFSESGYPWGGSGDALDALTICRVMPVRTTAPLSKTLRPNVPAAPQVGSRDPRSITDLLCRDEDGVRWGMTGWIWGKSTRSIYMAMCSLFIERESVLMVSAYEDSGNWGEYSITAAAEILREAEYEIIGVQSMGNASVEAWRRLVMNGPNADVLILNTSGSTTRMNLSGETVGTTRDIPALNRPLALHMIHSYSLNAPGSNSTIGGKWLDRGVYAYVGSCDEPYLNAFTPPSVLARRIANYTPFLVASRVDTGPMALPWRIVTIGDPLMLAESPPRRERRRVRVPLEEPPGSIDIRRRTLTRLSSVIGNDEEVVDPETLHDLHLLGQDELAMKLWEQLVERDGGKHYTPELARAVLPVLHARREATAYLAAYRAAGEPAGDCREMLWSLWTPRFPGLRSPSDLALFERALRTNQMGDDLEVLLPAAERILGASQRNAVIARAMDRATIPYDRDRLKALLK
ncbi:MAG: hypothetical protein MK082_02215 [Phycisphaerales bacterium]|nr:hypothetical protein [Phycisphaerales bacterium]